MCIEVANVASLAVLESEDDAPVSGDIYGPEAFQVASQAVEPPAWDVHVLGRGGDVEVSFARLIEGPEHSVAEGREPVTLN